MNHPLYEFALELTRSGVSLVPTNKHKLPDFDLLPTEHDSSGKPKRVWTPFQIEIPSDEWLKKWFVDHSPWGIAIVSGKVSGDLETLDFDVARGDCYYDEWSQIIQAEALELFMRLVISSTPSGGYHTRYRCPVIEGNQKLATRPFHHPETDHPEIETLIETRGEGGYALCPPSPGYAMIQGNLLNISVITPTEREFLLDTARSFNQAFDPPKRPTRQTAKAESDRPGDLYNATDDFKVLLEKHGWRMIRDLTDKEIWQRPGKDGPGGSATWTKVDIPCKRGILHARHFYVFTSSTQLAPNTSYRPFDLLAFLEFHGDFHVAAKSLLPAKPPPKKENRATQAFPPPPFGDAGASQDPSPNGGDKPPTDDPKESPEAFFNEIRRDILLAGMLDEGFERTEKTKAIINRLVGLAPVDGAAFIERMRKADLGTKAVLEEQLKAAIKAQAQERRQTVIHQPQPSALPNIVINTRQMREITADTLDALRIADAADPSLFVRSGMLTRVRVDEKDHALAQVLTVDSARGIMGRVANFLKETSREDIGITYTAVSPPEVIAKDILSLPSYPQFPPLVSVVGFPILSGSGEFRTQTGYDPESRCYYHAAGKIQIGDVEPTGANVQNAKRLIKEDILGDFPFVDKASLANTVAEMLTPLVRPLIRGATPLFAHDAATPGTGKTLLASVCTIPFSVSGASIMTQGRDDDEWRKRITAQLITGTSHILIDNIKTKLSSGDLSAALTVKSDWEDRILGQSQMIRLPVRCTWIATGNNLEFSDEIARRTVWIRLDAKVERPWKRTDFKHKDLESWVEAHRSEILAALMVFVKKWFALGKPAGEEVMGSYAEWTQIVGGILKAVGIEGFLENAEELYEQVDVEREAWTEFFKAWADEFGAYDEKSGTWGAWDESGQWRKVDAPAVGTKDLFPLASHSDSKDDPEGLGLLDSLLGRGDEHARRTNLGRILNKHKDRVFGHYRLERLRKRVDHAVQYRLVTVEPAGELTDEPSEVSSFMRKSSRDKDFHHAVETMKELTELKTTPSLKIAEADKTSGINSPDRAGMSSVSSADSLQNGQQSSGDKDSGRKEASISELPQTHAFLQAWQSTYGNQRVYVEKLIPLAQAVGFDLTAHDFSPQTNIETLLRDLTDITIDGLTVRCLGDGAYQLQGQPAPKLVGEVQDTSAIPKEDVAFLLEWYDTFQSHPAYRTTLLRIANRLFPVKMGLSVSDQMDAAIAALEGKVVCGLSIVKDESGYHLVGMPESEVSR